MLAAVRNGIHGIGGECGGCLDCATCHVYVDEEQASSVPQPSEEELELLSAVSGAKAEQSAELPAEGARPSRRAGGPCAGEAIMTGLVIIGASYAGVQAALTARDAGYSQPITIVCDEEWLPYQRPPLSKDFLLDTRLRAGVDLPCTGASRRPSFDLKSLVTAGDKAGA
nr:FAD-dependent oxidoreductase [Bradyrhizobium sp. CCBAU 45321]